MAALACWVPAGAAVISEIHYNPPLVDEGLEFIEVTNDTWVPEDISGYRFTEGIGPSRRIRWCTAL